MNLFVNEWREKSPWWWWLCCFSKEERGELECLQQLQQLEELLFLLYYTLLLLSDLWRLAKLETVSFYFEIRLDYLLEVEHASSYLSEVPAYDFLFLTDYLEAALVIFKPVEDALALFVNIFKTIFLLMNGIILFRFGAVFPSSVTGSIFLLDTYCSTIVLSIFSFGLR